MNALDVILNNEAKLELESFGYEFKDDIHIIRQPIGYPELYGGITTEIKKSFESNWEMAHHIKYIPLDYIDLLNDVKKANKILQNEFRIIGDECLFKPFNNLLSIETHARFTKLFNKHFRGLEIKFKIEIDGNDMNVIPLNEETKNIWEKRLL